MVRYVLSCCGALAFLIAGSTVQAETLLHWTFDGPLGHPLTQTSDASAKTTLHVVTASDGISSVTYGKPNPWFNSTGTSVELDCDPVWDNSRTALAAMDPGIDSIVDLSTQIQFTIELFFYPFALKNCVLFGKCTSQGQYALELRQDGSLRFYVNNPENSVVAPAGTAAIDRWHHVAAVFDVPAGEKSMRLYVDGALVGSGATKDMVRDSSDSLGVGAMVRWPPAQPQPDWTTKCFAGRIDELRISDVALEPGEFLLNAVTTKARYPYPEDRAEQFSRTTHLKWQPAKDVSAQRVYFGTDPAHLTLLREVGPAICSVSNTELGGRLTQEKVYYWRVDSRRDAVEGEDTADDSYGFGDKGQGETWSFTTQGDSVQPGYLKWLLHLGQNPRDRVLSYEPLHLFGGDAQARPRPGQICDLSDADHANHKMMIWTPQYSPRGCFGHEPIPGLYLHYYFVYLLSPDQRDARVSFRSFGFTKIWNNGHLICDQSFTFHRELSADFLLEEGVNAMLFKVVSPTYVDEASAYLAVRVVDPNANAFSDLTYSLEPASPPADVRVTRTLPQEYDPGSTFQVGLDVDIQSSGEIDEFRVIEVIPEGLSVADAGGGTIVDNTLWWTLRPEEVAPMDLRYRLSAPTGHHEVIPFIGYLYHDAALAEIVGDTVLFEDPPVSPADMADEIDTIEIDPRSYTQAERIAIGQEPVSDDSGSLMGFQNGLVCGLKPHKTGGWADYAFSVQNAGTYQVILDYGELWTMFHQAAEVSVTIDGSATLHCDLPSTTHGYDPGRRYIEVERPWTDPDRKARWIVGELSLAPGNHTLRLEFPQFCSEETPLDWRTDGRPVVTNIILTNYPGLTVPRLAEPHHLDSYEHAPACLVRDRDIAILPDGCVEMTIYGALYSLSQGNEVYFVKGSFLPRTGSDEAKFEIVSFEPEVFHLPPEGRQDFAFTVRSKEPVPEDYSELATIWVQGVPSAPSKRPHLFTTAREYIGLPPYNDHPFAWSPIPLFDLLRRATYVTRDVTDDAKVLIPDRYDLGFERGRYKRTVEEFFQKQFHERRLPSVESIFRDMQWDEENYGYGYLTLGQIWSGLVASPYWRDSLGLGREYTRRLAENMVFYPVPLRWDWARPEYLPPYLPVDLIRGVPALAPHIRSAQEGMVDDAEQFRVLHNLVLPVLNSCWDQLRVQAVLMEDANMGDTSILIDRPLYGRTGSSTDGSVGMYLLIDGDPYRPGLPEDDHKMLLAEPLRRLYPRGTVVTDWSYYEELELECLDIFSLCLIAGASRDWAVADQTAGMISEILAKQEIFTADGSFKNEPGSYGHDSACYPHQLVNLKWLFGDQALRFISDDTWDRMRNYLINALRFVFSNGKIAMLNGGGGDEQLGRSYGEVALADMLEVFFPEDSAFAERYRRVYMQEQSRIPGDVVDNENFVIHGYGYAMLRSENGSWDRGMETLLSSKHLLSDPGDHVSRDGLGIVVYGLGAVLTPRYGYSWIGYLPPFLNQVMIDEKWQQYENAYYGSFWHFDGREELPCAVAHTGDGDDCSNLDYDMSRWCVQFPEYLFDAYFVKAKDPNVHQYDWSLINMGELEVVEPAGLSWQDYSAFLAGYWPADQGAGTRSIAVKESGRVVADWNIRNAPWAPEGDGRVLRYPAAHSGRLRLIMTDDDPGYLINAQIGYWYQPWSGARSQANSQDVLVIRKNAGSHTFVDTLEPIADDEEAYVKDIVVVARGGDQQQLVKVTTTEGEDWVYLSGRWGARPDGDTPLPDITTDADIVAWRVEGGSVTRFYLANGSYALTEDGQWRFEAIGNHYDDNHN